MTHILIMTTALYLGSTGASVQTAEFNNKQACENAGKQQELMLESVLKIKADRFKFYAFVCVPKG